MTPRRALVSALMATAVATAAVLPVWAQNEMSFTADEVEGSKSLFDRVDAGQGDQSSDDAMRFDENSIARDNAEHDALACAAGLGCEGLGVNQDDALVLTGHNTVDTAREAYQEQYREPVSDQDTPVDEDAGIPAGSGDEAEDGDSLFDRVDAAQEEGPSDDAMRFDENSIARDNAEHDALACAAGLGCEGLGVNQDDALVLTGHNTVDTALEAYQEQYGEPVSDPTDLSDDTDSGDMSFTEEEASENADSMSFTEEEASENADSMSFTEEEAFENADGISFTEDEVGADMSFTEEEVLHSEAGTLPENRFTDAEIATFGPEEDALWACAAAFGCKGAAAGLTPHQALHRLGLPDYSYQWPLAACATNAPGACEEIGITLLDGMRIMSHLVNPNR